ARARRARRCRTSTSCWGSTKALAYNHPGRRKRMRYLHTMVRVKDLDAALDFYCDKLGLVEVNRMESEKGRFTLVFLAAPDDADKAKADQAPCVELTYNWDTEDYGGGR